MGDRTASIKIGLKAQGYVSGLRDIKGQTDRAARDMGSSFRNGMNAGFRGAFESIKSGFAAVKTFVGGLGLFAGVIGIKEQVGHAIKMEASYRKLAFAIRSGTGEAKKWRDIQADVHGLSLETGQSTEDLAQGYSLLFKEVGKAAFARQGIHAIATTATATGESIQTLTEITGVLNEKFGVTADEIPETLAAVVASATRAASPSSRWPRSSASSARARRRRGSTGAPASRRSSPSSTSPTRRTGRSGRASPP